MAKELLKKFRNLKLVQRKKIDFSAYIQNINYIIHINKYYLIKINDKNLEDLKIYIYLQI